MLIPELPQTACHKIFPATPFYWNFVPNLLPLLDDK